MSCVMFILVNESFMKITIIKICIFSGVDWKSHNATARFERIMLKKPGILTLPKSIIEDLRTPPNFFCKFFCDDKNNQNTLPKRHWK